MPPITSRRPSDENMRALMKRTLGHRDVFAIHVLYAGFNQQLCVLAVYVTYMVYVAVNCVVSVRFAVKPGFG